MSVCNWCLKEMTDHPDTCEGNCGIDYPDGKTYIPLPYFGPGERCHDCGIKRGGRHHPGCDMERCPRCGGQLIGCGCMDPENIDCLPAGAVDPVEYQMEEVVTNYVMKHYVDDHCTLCGNSGVIDTTSVRTPTGVLVGKRQFCLCPNGMAMRRRAHR